MYTDYCMPITYALSLTGDEIRMPLLDENFRVNSDCYKSNYGTYVDRVQDERSVCIDALFSPYANFIPCRPLARGRQIIAELRSRSFGKTVQWRSTKSRKNRGSCGSSLPRWSVSWKGKRILFIRKFSLGVRRRVCPV